MPLESPIIDLSSLNELWPLASDLADLQLESDDHTRGITAALHQTFVTLGQQGGTVDASAAELNHLAGSSGPVQSQITAKASRWLYTADRAGVLILAPNDLILVEAQTASVNLSLPGAVAAGTEIEVKHIGPAHDINVLRMSPDTITDIDQAIYGLTVLTMLPGEHWHFVFSAPNEWVAWPVSG